MLLWKVSRSDYVSDKVEVGLYFLVYELRIILLCHRKPACDIRIQLPNVSLEHAVVKVDEKDKVKFLLLP